MKWSLNWHFHKANPPGVQAGFEKKAYTFTVQ